MEAHPGTDLPPDGVSPPLHPTLRAADISVAAGDDPGALRAYLDYISSFDENGAPGDLAAALYRIALIHGRTGDHEQARDYLERTIERAHAADDHHLHVRALRDLSAVCSLRGDVETALEYSLRAFTVYALLEDREGMASTAAVIGDCYERQGSPEMALSFQTRALELLEKRSDPLLLATVLLNLGRLHHALGEDEPALSVLERGLTLVGEHEDGRLRCRLLCELSRVLESLGEVERALGALREYMELRERFSGEEQRKAIAEITLRFDTERELREEEIRRRNDVVRAVMEAQEIERRRIARDLHDGVGQMLAAARINLERVRETTASGPLDRAVDILGKAAADVRAISHALGTSTLRELGLAEALDELLAGVGTDEGLRFQLVTAGMERPLPEEIGTALFRVAQELIANILRHARAGEATVQVVRGEDEIRLTVEDDGVGFDTDAPGTGMGLRNIAARVAAIGGLLHFDSVPGHGVTVTVAVGIDRPGRLTDSHDFSGVPENRDPALSGEE